MTLFLLCPNPGWIQGQFNFTELSLRYLSPIELAGIRPDLILKIYILLSRTLRGE